MGIKGFGTGDICWDGQR